MSFELMFPGKVLIAETKNKRFKRDDVAKTYAMALNSSREIDWRAVNSAVIDRWSFAGLEYIKDKAHKIAYGKKK